MSVLASMPDLLGILIVGFLGFGGALIAYALSLRTVTSEPAGTPSAQSAKPAALKSDKDQIDAVTAEFRNIYAACYGFAKLNGADPQAVRNAVQTFVDQKFPPPAPKPPVA